MPFDAFLELEAIGESQDSKRAEAIAIASFTFGNSSMLEKASKQRKQQIEYERNNEEEEDDFGDFDKEEDNRTGKQKQDYRFQVSKEIDVASPRLMQAFFSGSKRGNRPTEFNHFKSAIVTLRRLGGKSERPQTYLRFVFSQVEVVGFELETQGRSLPTEEVSFAFMTVEMEYTPQTHEGAKVQNRQLVRWNFAKQDETVEA